MDISIPRLLYEDTWRVFLLVTVFLGGGASWLMGRAVAGTWRPWWHVAVYALVLGATVRWLHYALFRGTLGSLHYYAVDAIVCLILGFVAFRMTRASQMSTQYGWIIERYGLLRWRRRSGDSGAEIPDSG